MSVPPFDDHQVFAIDTVGDCHMLIRVVEEWIRQGEVMQTILTEMIFKRVPQVLCITGSAAADLEKINDILFHLAYIRERLIIRVYEIERAQTQLVAVPNASEGDS